MSISSIDSDRCNGCGICVDACPLDVIRLDEKTHKAVIAYPEECEICEWCVEDCAQGAITVEISKSSPLMTSWG